MFQVYPARNPSGILRVTKSATGGFVLLERAFSLHIRCLGLNSYLKVAPILFLFIGRAAVGAAMVNKKDTINSFFMMRRYVRIEI